MKLFVIAAVLGVCAAGRLDNTYLPPNRGSNFGSSAYSGGGGGGFGAPGFGQTQHSGNVYNAGAYNAGGFGGGFGGGYQGASRSHEANAQILRYNSDVTGDHFNYDFETSNGIRAEASGIAGNGVQERGSFGYKGDDGHDYSITYTADENGYRPQGAHLPTSPPIPEAILKSLEQNAKDEAAGISDDGSYRGEGSHGGYSGPSGQYGAPSPAYQAPHGGFGGGAAASRQYLAPNAGGRGGSGGSGNFNSQSGYHY